MLFFGLFGSFAVLGFLLVYGLVPLASLRVSLPGHSQRRRLLVGSACLVAVSAMAVAYVSGVVGQQNGMLLSFAVLLLIGALRARGCCQLPETAAQPQVITVGTSMPVRCLISAS